MLAISAAASAGGSAAWESNSYADFAKGRFHGVSLTRDGQLTLAPKLDTLFASGEAGVWAMIAGKDGSVYLGTGHRGRLYRIAPGGKPEVIWNAPQSEIFAITLDSKGVLYAATSPDGRVWRIENGKAREWFNPQSKYIWSLATGTDGAIYAGTGPDGHIYRITGEGKGELWYDTNQTHVTALAMDAKGRLLAGTEPNGILYRVEGKDKAFVLYDSSLPEIRSIVPSADGSVYVAALGGGVVQKQAQAAAANQAAQAAGTMVTTSITVTDAAANTQAGLDLKAQAAQQKTQQQPATEATITTPNVTEVSGVEKSALYRIYTDNTAETLWSSKEENIFDMVLRGADIDFATDAKNRVYRLTPDLKTTLLVEAREGEPTRMVTVKDALLVSTNNLGKVFQLTSPKQPEGTYESSVHDAGNAARWGRIEWRGMTASGGIKFKTRSGNSARPDRTWSEWAEVKDAPSGTGATIQSPNARYVQWQAELKGASGAAAKDAPQLDSVTLTYQPRNTRPVVRSIQANAQWAANPAHAAQAAASANAAYSITVTDSGDAPNTSSGTPTQNLQRSGTTQVVLSWQADDPEGDRLVYSLWYRAEDERDWKLLKENLTDNVFTQDAEVFADGRYLFRVVASDRLANPPADARENELVSQPVLIDQTPPHVTIAAPQRNGTTVTLQVDAQDSVSPLRKAEYSVDAKTWQLVEAADGITDGQSERFVIQIEALTPGEHTVTVRVLDAAGNPGLAKTVLRQ